MNNDQRFKAAKAVLLVGLLMIGEVAISQDAMVPNTAPVSDDLPEKTILAAHQIN